MVAARETGKPLLVHHFCRTRRDAREIERQYGTTVRYQVNFHALAYAGMGGKVRAVESSDTIRTQTYYDRGEPLKRSRAATCPAPGMMVATEILEYDDGDDGGNGLLTARTLRV